MSSAQTTLFRLPDSLRNTEASSDKSARLEGPQAQILIIACLPSNTLGNSGARLRQAYGAAGPRPTNFPDLPLRLRAFV